MPNLAEALAFYVVFLFSTTLHEAAHAWTALRGGDLTAYEGGQVTLDPRPHIRREPFGMVVLPLLTAVLTGWPFGFASAPYNPDWARRHPHRAAVMSLAGPGANLLLMLLAALLIRAGVAAGVFDPPVSAGFSSLADPVSGSWAGPATMLSVFFSLNLLLAVFNLIPVPPLDGSGAMPLVLGRERGLRYQEFVWGNPMLGWLGIFVAWQLIQVIFPPVFRLSLSLLYPGAAYG